MWLDEWRALKARIRGIQDGAVYFLRADTGETHNSAGEIINAVHSLVRRIADFSEVHGQVMPIEARNSCVSFLRRYNDTFGGLGAGISLNATGYDGAVAVLTYTSIFASEFDYLIAGTSELVRSLTVRAFLHLQRSIVADPIIRERWQNAFTSGERECEKMGSLHLLQHGIWAFKASGPGEATDLIYDEPRLIDTDERRASAGIVLTEWKKVNSLSELDAKAQAALGQARRYAGGILAGIDIASTRYLVMVSEEMMPMPSQVIDGDLTYEYRNVAVNPGTPSKQR